MEPPNEVLEDIDLRFIRTAPKESLGSVEHIMFLVEHAYWYYEDHVREKNPALRHYSKWQDFAKLMFQRGSPLLKQHVGNFDEYLERFRRFKRLIPVYGAILMDAAMSRVLLVRGYKSASGWGFPRGKVNAGEEGIVCAAREVHEETGIDIESMLSPEDFIQVTADGKPHTLFIVAGIDPDTTVCAPKTKGEIGAYGWHYVKDLPATLDEANQVYMSSSGVKHRFFMVQPFVRPLREWIRNRQIQMGLIAAKGGKGAKAAAAAAAAVAAAAKLSVAASTSDQASMTVAAAAAAATVNSTSAATAATVAAAASTLLSAAMNGSHGPATAAAAPAAPRRNPLTNFSFDRDAILRCLVQA